MKIYIYISVILCLGLLTTNVSSSDLLILSEDGQYRYKDNLPKKILDGTSLTDDFVAIMTTNSAALQKVRSFETFSTIALAGQVATTIIVLRFLLDTLDSKKQLDNGQLPKDEKPELSDFLPLIVSGVVTVSASNKAKTDLKEGFRIFNQNVAVRPTLRQKTNLAYSIGFNPFSASLDRSTPSVSANLQVSF